MFFLYPVAGKSKDFTLHLTHFELGSLAWTWKDFRFDDDPVRGDNALGGTLTHVITTSLGWQTTDRLAPFPTAKWVPEKTRSTT